MLARPTDHLRQAGTDMPEQGRGLDLLQTPPDVLNIVHENSDASGSAFVCGVRARKGGGGMARLGV